MSRINRFVNFVSAHALTIVALNVAAGVVMLFTVYVYADVFKC